MKERNKEKKREDFSIPSFVMCLSLTQDDRERGKEEPSESRDTCTTTGTPLSLLERGKKASARGVCQFVRTVRRSGASTPTDADVADAISSFSLSLVISSSS